MSTPLAGFRRALAEGAARALDPAATDQRIDALARQVRVPDPAHGDLALACFEPARALGLTPPEVAFRVAAALANHPVFSMARAAGPFVNVRIDPDALSNAVVPEARTEAWGGGTEGHGRTVVIDYSSPNIAKPLAFHHIRSTVIGAAVARICTARGYTVVGINYLGDWGKQFGLLANGFRAYGDPARRADAKHLVEVYVRANREADVESRRAAIDAPAQARVLVTALEQARRALDDLVDPAGAKTSEARKTAEGAVKAAEKRLRTVRGITDKTRDALEDVTPWLAGLDARATTAREELPAAEARDHEARLHLRKMEAGEPEAMAEWREFRETSVRDFLRVYARMGIGFTAMEGESSYTHVLDATVARVAEQPGIRLDQGATVVDLAAVKDEPPVMLKTRDGTTLYITRDIAAALDRHARYGFDRSLYVVAQDQALHFQQLIRTLRAMGCAWAERVQHVAFGRVHGMSTRRGEVVFLDEVLDEAVDRARAVCEGSDRIDQARLRDTIEAVGVGAVVFGDLKNPRANDYAFNLEEVLNFDGLTGPYVQYTQARLASIVRKAGGVPPSADLNLLTLDEERAVLLSLGRYPEAVAEACVSAEPSLVARALLDLAQCTSQYLSAGARDRSRRVLLEDHAALRAARLHLVDAARNTLSVGLGLLGVKAPEAM